MDNLTRIRNNHGYTRRNIKKNFRYNDSINMYKKTISNYMQKSGLNPKGNFEQALSNLKESLKDSSIEFYQKEKYKKKENEGRNNYRTNNKYNLVNKRTNLSVPKHHHYERTTTPSINKLLIQKKLSYLDSKKSMKNLYFKTINNYNRDSSFYRSRDNYSHSHNSKRNYSRPSYRSILNLSNLNYMNTINNDTDYIKFNTIKYDDSFKNKELNNVNIILQKQNKQLRQNTREMRYKINDLLNNIKLLRMDNQRLNNEKNQVLMAIRNLENELDNNKNMSLNELEIKKK